MSGDKLPLASPATSDPTIAEMRRFALASLRASAAVFYWIDDDMRMRDVALTGVSEALFARYQGGMQALDPLNVPRLTGSGRRVATLQDAENLVPAEELATYKGFLREHEITDVLDLLFWQDGFAFAGLGICKKHTDPPFSPDAVSFADAMQPYIEFNLGTHPRIKSRHLKRRLTSTYRLTSREVEVTELVRCGCTNRDIAAELGLALATVKTHLLRIFQKLGVENRTAMSSRVGALADDIARIAA